MNKYQIIYEYVYNVDIGYTFKKQICISDNKKIIFNFIVNDGFSDNLLLTNFNSDFRDNVLNIKIKEFLLNEIKYNIKLKTLRICLKGIKCDVKVLKNSIRVNDKTFRLINNEYHTLEHKVLDYINTLKQ